MVVASVPTNMTSDAFEDVTADMLNFSTRKSKEFRRQFIAYFGTSSLICTALWTLIKAALPNGYHMKHLLWTLMWYKLYSTEDVLASIAKTTRKTFRKWVKIITLEIGELKLVRIV